AVPKFGYISSCWAANRHYQIRLPLGTSLFHVVGYGLLHLRGRISRHAQRNFIQINPVAHLLDQLGLKSRRTSGEGRRDRSERVNNENALRLGGVGRNCKN